MYLKICYEERIMKTRFIEILFLLISSTCIYADHPVRHVEQVVIWGRKFDGHTHSYIHYGFHRAFQHLGYKTHWIDIDSEGNIKDNLANIDFANSLFIIQAFDNNLPIRDDSFYIIHNLEETKYQSLKENGHCIALQVYTHDCLDRKETKLDNCMYYDIKQPVIYLPWATDLLPHEIEANKRRILDIKKEHVATFVGCIYGESFGNQIQIDSFKRACTENKIEFKQEGACSTSMEDNIRCVQKALLAPAIQGEWQCQQGYIPCRIFKNISYGAMPITNSKTVWELFDKKIIYNPNPYQLGLEAIQHLKTWNMEVQYKLMDLVKEKHTYLNRIETLFQFFEMVSEYKQKQG